MNRNYIKLFLTIIAFVLLNIFLFSGYPGGINLTIFGIVSNIIFVTTYVLHHLPLKNKKIQKTLKIFFGILSTLLFLYLMSYAFDVWVNYSVETVDDSFLLVIPLIFIFYFMLLTMIETVRNINKKNISFEITTISYITICSLLIFSHLVESELLYVKSNIISILLLSLISFIANLANN